MATPYVINLNRPDETPQTIAEKLNKLNGAVDVSVIRDGMSKTEFENWASSNSSKINSKFEDADKRNFNHIEATYARVGGRNKMTDLRYHGGGTPITVSAIAPTNPKLNDLWFDIS